MTRIRTLSNLIAIALLSGTGARGGILSQSDPQAGGIFYRWTAAMTEETSVSMVRHVGAWSWEDESLFDPGAGETPVGWTHTSDWVALTLDNPAWLTIRLERKEGVPNPTSQNPDNVAQFNLYPGFTVYSGWDNDLAPQSFADEFNNGTPTHDWHTYNNRGNIPWAEDLSYVAHREPDGSHMVEASFLLEAGQYSIVLGGNSISTVNEPRQGYEATFTTTPVPEPTSALLTFAGALALLARRRR